jgi:hypothetical protein
VLSPIQYGQTAFGNIGELWGVYAIMSTVSGSIVDKDVIVVGTKKYEVVYNSNTIFLNLPSKYLAIRIE